MRRSLLAAACVVAALSARPAEAQVVYHYVGNPFTTFCTTNTCVNQAGVYGSYTATDHIEVTVALDAALPPNMSFQDITQRPGFHLTMSDGQQTLTDANRNLLGAMVATDANGHIVAWHITISLFTSSGERMVYTSSGPIGENDTGGLVMDGPAPNDYAYVLNAPGIWTGGGTGVTPAGAVQNLIAQLPNLLGPRSRVLTSLTDKLTDVLASINGGLTTDAINQLNAFKNQVEGARKTGRISAPVADTLIAEADAIIAMLSLTP